jgi:hypothetical protein
MEKESVVDIIQVYNGGVVMARVLGFKVISLLGLLWLIFNISQGLPYVTLGFATNVDRGEGHLTLTDPIYTQI